jgi:hypothetical protein
MISLEMARQLQAAGLGWTPVQFDTFGIPDRNLDDKTFVISDMLVTADVLGGLPIVSFQGAAEWALDYIVTTEIVWIPSEMQLRQRLEAALLEGGRPELQVSIGLNGCRLECVYGGRPIILEGADLEQLYAHALLHILSTTLPRE